MSRRLLSIRLAVLATFLSTAHASADAMFMGLGDLAGGQFASLPDPVSADGSTVVGASISASGREAFRWMSGGGMVGLGAEFGRT